MKRTISSTIKQITNIETGEVFTYEDSKTYKEKIDSEKFYMVFIDYISPLFELNSINARKLLDWMCRHAEFNTGQVLMSIGIRQDIEKELGLIPTQISKCIKILKEKGLIEGDKGTYVVNPQIFWKGEQQIRNEVLKNKELKITYEITDAE